MALVETGERRVARCSVQLLGINETHVLLARRAWERALSSSGAESNGLRFRRGDRKGPGRHERGGSGFWSIPASATRSATRVRCSGPVDAVAEITQTTVEGRGTLS